MPPAELAKFHQKKKDDAQSKEKKNKEKCKAYRAKLTRDALKRTKSLTNLTVSVFQLAKAFACVDDQDAAAQPSTSSGLFAQES